MKIMESKTFKLAIVTSVLMIIYFICTSQFWAHWGIVLILIGFWVMLFFLITFICCIVSWISGYKKYPLSYVPFFIVMLTITIAYCLPSHNRSKKYYKHTGELCNYQKGNCVCNLYAEYYCVETGYMTTDVNAEYLTDSVNFRKYLDVYDEGDEHINVTCKGDKITVTKTSSEMWSKPQVLERKTYSLAFLKNQHVFE